MKKNSFNLTGKAVDCSELAALGDAGKEIFRASKVACDPAFCDSIYPVRHGDKFIYMKNGKVWSGEYEGVYASNFKVIHPIDVLSQAAINAAMDGATLVFEGDVIPSGKITRYWNDGSKENINMVSPLNVALNKNIIGYKPLAEKKREKSVMETVNDNFALPNNIEHGNEIHKSVFACDSENIQKGLNPQHEFYAKMLSEKVGGFKELCSVCSPSEWADRERETYESLVAENKELKNDVDKLLSANVKLKRKLNEINRISK